MSTTSESFLSRYPYKRPTVQITASRGCADTLSVWRPAPVARLLACGATLPAEPDSQSTQARRRTKRGNKSSKVSRLSRALATALDELASTFQEANDEGAVEPTPGFDAGQLRNAYATLRKSIEDGGSVAAEVSKLIEKMGKEELKAFVRTNDLPLEERASKAAIQKQLVQLLRQSQAITAPVKSLANLS